MPIYEYRCDDCAVKYEKIVPSASSEAPPCPNCSSTKVVKLISVPGGMTGGSAQTGPCGATRASCSSGFS